MTSDKYTPFESKLENLLKGIDSRVHEIRGIVAGMYDRLSELTETTDAVYKTVTYRHPNEPASIADDEWDFLDEEE